MTTYMTTYIVTTSLKYGEPGHADAQAAASAINKILGDTGESSYINGDEAGEMSACRAILREIASCHWMIADDIEFVKETCEMELDD